LRALQSRRAELQGMLIAETNRLEHASHKSVLKSLKAHIAMLEAAFEAIEAEIAELVATSDGLRAKVQLMRTVKGVGFVTATTLLAYLPDIGQLTRGQVARRTGLAPINDDSGKKRGARHVEAGRSEIRRCLYMAAVVAANYNPALRTFAARLKARGYPFKYVVTAVMRKLVVILNAVLRDGEPWRGAKTAQGQGRLQHPNNHRQQAAHKRANVSFYA
jgi:transposase